MTPSKKLVLLKSSALPPMAFDADFVANTYLGGTLASLFTVARASANNTDLVPISAQGAAYDTFAANTARRDANGLLIEPTRANKFLNSLTPATQTITLAVGTQTVWVNGSGSVTVAAGTAVGTGFGVATQGNPLIITITTAGTAVFTVAGSLNTAQNEVGSWGTSLITTAGSAVTRNADAITLTDPTTLFNLSEGTILFEWQHLADYVTSKVLTSIYIDTNNRLRLLVLGANGAVQLILFSGSGQIFSLLSARPVVMNGIYRAAFSWRDNNFNLAVSQSLDTNILTSNTGTMFGGTPTIYLGSENALSQLGGRVRRFAHAKQAASPAALRKWAQAA